MKYKLGDMVRIISLPKASSSRTSHMLGQELEIVETREKYDRCSYGIVDPDNNSTTWFFKEENLKPSDGKINPRLKVGDKVKILYSRKKKYQDIIDLEGYIKAIKYNFQYPQYVDTIRVEIPGLPLNDTEDGCWLFEREKDLQLLEREERVVINKDMIDSFCKFDGYGQLAKWEKHVNNGIIDDIIKYNNKGEFKMELLNIYQQRKQIKISEEFENKRKELRKKDTLYTKLLKLKEEYENRLSDEHALRDDGYSIFSLNNYKAPKALMEEFNDLEREEDSAYSELSKLVEEVKAQLSICETYEQKMNILKVYGILTEEGKINID